MCIAIWRIFPSGSLHYIRLHDLVWDRNYSIPKSTSTILLYSKLYVLYNCFQVALDGERLRVDELQVALGEAESERDNLLEMKDKIDLTQRKLSEVEERETLLLKDIDDIKGKHAFAQAEFEKERDELNDVVTKSKLLLQVRIFVVFENHKKVSCASKASIFSDEKACA